IAEHIKTGAQTAVFSTVFAQVLKEWLCDTGFTNAAKVVNRSWVLANAGADIGRRREINARLLEAATTDGVFFTIRSLAERFTGIAASIFILRGKTTRLIRVNTNIQVVQLTG